MGNLAAYAPVIGSALAGAFEGLTAPTPYQPLTPYAGPNSAESTAYTVGSHLDDLWKAIGDRARQPVSLPDAVVQPMHGLSGGDLPFQIGHFNDPGSLSTPASLPGLNLPDSALQNPNSQPGSPTFRNPIDPNTMGTSIGNQLRDKIVNQPPNAATPQPAPVRQKFAPSNYPSAVQSPQTTDPRLAAIELLRNAAQAA